MLGGRTKREELWVVPDSAALEKGVG
jgi:hypothetical protein